MKRRDEDPAAGLPPLDATQKPVVTTLACLREGVDWVVHAGSTNSGKSFGIMLALFAYLSTTKVPAANARLDCIGLTADHLADGIMSDWETIAANTSGIVSTNKQRKLYTVRGPGKDVWEVRFFSVDKPKKALGGKRHLLFVNEAIEHDWATIQQLAARTARTVVCDYNPTNDTSWLNTHVLQPDQDYRFYRSTYLDNKYVPLRILRQIEWWRINDYETYRVFGLGLNGKVAGLVMKPFTIGAFPAHEDLEWWSYGIDYGYSDHPTAITEIGVRGPHLYWRQHFYEPTADPDDISEAFRNAEITGVIHGDRDQVMTNELRKRGHNIVMIDKPPGSVEAGLKIINGYLNVVDPCSTDIIREFRTYKRRKVGDAFTSIIPKNDDAIDSGRYALVGHTQPKPSSGKSLGPIVKSW